MLKRTLSLIAFLALTSTVMAQECDTALEDAQENFDQQRYNQLIGLLTDCPPGRFLERTRKIVAYELLARAYFGQTQIDSSKAAINRLLDLQPNYAPQPPQYSDEYIKTVDDVKSERARQQPRSLFRSRWFWIGGATLSSVAAFLVLNQSDGPSLLPEAPDPPGNR